MFRLTNGISHPLEFQDVHLENSDPEQCYSECGDAQGTYIRLTGGSGWKCRFLVSIRELLNLLEMVSGTLYFY